MLPYRARAASPTTEICSSSTDHQLLPALLRGDEIAFALLIARYQEPLTRLALRYVPNRSIAEDAVQETWLGVWQGLRSYEGRASLRAWIVRILINRAITIGSRERCYVAWSSWYAQDTDAGAGPVHERGVNMNRVALPDDQAVANELDGHIRRLIAALPLKQRVVITLRDIEGRSSVEVCTGLRISTTH